MLYRRDSSFYFCEYLSTWLDIVYMIVRNDKKLKNIFCTSLANARYVGCVDWFLTSSYKFVILKLVSYLTCHWNV